MPGPKEEKKIDTPVKTEQKKIGPEDAYKAYLSYVSNFTTGRLASKIVNAAEKKKGGIEKSLSKLDINKDPDAYRTLMSSMDMYGKRMEKYGHLAKDFANSKEALQNYFGQVKPEDRVKPVDKYLDEQKKDILANIADDEKKEVEGKLNDIITQIKKSETYDAIKGAPDKVKYLSYLAKVAGLFAKTVEESLGKETVTSDDQAVSMFEGKAGAGAYA